MKSILIANRGEIAIRIAQAAAELGLDSVAVHTTDDAGCLHVQRATRAVALPGQGVAGYLDAGAIVTAALDHGCDAIHPGYGFLSESASFARAVIDAQLTFIGPSPEALQTLGNKTAAIELARELKVPVNPGTGADTRVDQIRALMQSLGGDPIILKAAAGGGGRGMRIVHTPDELDDALLNAQREALAAFGDGSVYAERFVPRARHIEVQIVGDGQQAVHVWERDCSLQRRHQKLVEIAPAPGLSAAARDQMLEASISLASAAGYQGLGTFEFLVDEQEAIAFIECNPRLQVEHTVTEAVTGIDLVQAQIQIAGGSTLAALGLTQAQIPEPTGSAVQARVNLEQMNEDGSVRPTGGTIANYQLPGGAGVRVDGHGYAGLRTSPYYDSLLAKVICHSPGGFDAALNKSQWALGAFRIDGVATNIRYLSALLELTEVRNGQSHTRLIEQLASQLAAASRQQQSQPGSAGTTKTDSGTADPLGVIQYGHESATAGVDADATRLLPGAVSAPMQGTILSVQVEPGTSVRRGTVLMMMEAMKMQHQITADHAGIVREISISEGDTVYEGDLIAVLEPSEQPDLEEEGQAMVDLEMIRPDLQEVNDRKSLLSDEARPEAIAKRHKLGKRSARENIAQLTDENSFVEYGDLTFAAQRVRRSADDLMRNTPADGLVTGFATVNGDLFGPAASRTAVLAYDYTVLAGTQGIMNHNKKDRMFEVIEKQRTPVIFFCEGGGGRPGDVDASDTSLAGLNFPTFHHYARLSGLVPIVGIASGRLFAGNAALLGCSDVVIATRDACIGMGGPAMIEGGGLGLFRPDEVGPTDVQAPNGVIDILVDDEEQAVNTARQYLSYFQGAVAQWQAPDERVLRHVVPQNRLQVYDVHDAIHAIADQESVLELRRDFAPGMVTAFIRVAGKPIGVLANNPIHLAGAIDSAAADKGARFLKLCDAFDMPVLSLVDTPGMMVGPEVEKTALVRHCCRLFLAGANLRVPLMTIILRKFYGLGAQAMCGGSTRIPLFCVGWPSAELGGMGLEGAVKLGYRKELEAIDDMAERKALFDKLVAQLYDRGKALNAASVLEIDTVIDPADSRQWVIAALEAAPAPEQRIDKKRAYVDSW